MNNRWINLETINPEGKINLICFPYSGTGASFYASWGKKAPKELNILPVSYPMREKRISEKMPASLVQLAEDFANESEELLNGLPFVLYGHCTGSIVAYEYAKAIQKKYGKTPSLFISASSPSPDFNHVKPLDESISDNEFAEKMAEMGLINPVLAKDESFVQYFMPMIKSDYILHQNYRCTCEKQLSCPITVFYGSQDTNLVSQDISGWNNFTGCSFQTVSLEEGHFFNKDESLLKIFGYITDSVLKGGIN